MKTGLLCIILLIFTILIFGGNHFAARNQIRKPDCPNCDCTVELVSVVGATTDPKPSCSVAFVTSGEPFGKKGDVVVRESITSVSPGPFGHIKLGWKVPSTCVFSVFCDSTHLAKVTCAGVDSQAPVDPSQKCTFQCGGRLDWKPCDHWERKHKKSEQKKKKSGSFEQASAESSVALASTIPSASVMSGFLPAKYNDEVNDDQEAKETITGPTRWRLFEGEAGIEKGLLMVASGEAEARSFCTGYGLRLNGPNAVSMPTCQFDVSGRWQGAYARPASKGTREVVSFTLDLRKESDSWRGELKTSNGTFNILEGSQSGSTIKLRAERADAGMPAKIVLNGRLAKGEIVFDGSEQSPGSAVVYGLIGYVKRLYIADSALPTAIVNQPYNFTLMAVSPSGGTTTFRLANPATKQPEQITWNTTAESLRGRNGERFTYLCPPNGTLSRSLYRGNAYTDDSSICTAAVNSHVINQQAGGVVTIQIQPGPSPGTGRFVPGAGEPQGGERGRLPSGLTFDNQSGTFTGTPTEFGSFEIGVVAEDGAGNVFEQPFTLTVKKLAVTSKLIPDAFIGQPYVATLKAAGGKPPYQFSASGLPAGLQLNPNTGELTGNPERGSQGSRSFSVVVRDGQNNSDPQDVSLSVRGTTILDSYFLPDATIGEPYLKRFQAVGNASPLAWSIEPNVVGLALNAQTGELTGTPTKGGTFIIQVHAQGGNSVHSRRFGLTIKEKGTQPALSMTAVPMRTTGLYTLGLLMVPTVVGFVAYRARRRKRALRFG